MLDCGMHMGPRPPGRTPSMSDLNIRSPGGFIRFLCFAFMLHKLDCGMNMGLRPPGRSSQTWNVNISDFVTLVIFFYDPCASACVSPQMNSAPEGISLSIIFHRPNFSSWRVTFDSLNSSANLTVTIGLKNPSDSVEKYKYFLHLFVFILHFFIYFFLFIVLCILISVLSPLHDLRVTLTIETPSTEFRRIFSNVGHDFDSHIDWCRRSSWTRPIFFER